MNVKNIKLNIIKPELDLIKIQFIKSSFCISELNDKNLLLKLQFKVLKSNINLLSLINWINFQLDEFNLTNKINSLKLINWDDDKEFDFETSNYSLFFIFSIKNYETKNLNINNLISFIFN